MENTRAVNRISINLKTRVLAKTLKPQAPCRRSSLNLLASEEVAVFHAATFLN